MGNNYLIESRKYKGVHYKELAPEMLEYLHKRSLEMLKEVVRILDKHGIKYMICGGTLLGAVTTGKFIPWDDDVDMCVFEDEYDLMTRVLIDELPQDMVFQCDKTDKRYFHGWGKVRDKRSVTYPGEPLYKENGVWIDIYKLVPMRENEILLNKTKEHIDYLKRRYRAGGITRDEYWKRIRDNKLGLKLITGELESVVGIKRKKVCVLRSASGITLDEEWCFPVRTYNFEGMKLTGFKDGEKYLINHYGEGYRELPVEELRQISINKVEIN